MGLEVLANRFIFKRGWRRGLTHILIMWGCIIAVLITFPLVFGWLAFRPVAGDLSLYETVIFGFPAFRFPHASARFLRDVYSTARLVQRGGAVALNYSGLG